MQETEDDALIRQEQDQRHHMWLRMTTSALLWLVHDADFQPVEMFLSLLVFLWVALLLFAPGLFRVSHAYDVMAVVAPQQIWGMVAAVIVCWHSFAVTVWRPYRWTRSGAILAIFAWDTFCGLMFAAAGIPSYGAGSHFIFACLAAWSLWRYAGRPHA